MAAILARNGLAGRPAIRIALRLAFALAVLGASPFREACAASARVQYVSATNVYVDAGRTAGLQEGAAVSVTRDGKEIARLTAVFVADHSAACRVESLSGQIRVGDACTFTAAAASDSAGADAAKVRASADSTRQGAANAAPGTRPASWSRPGRVRGRISSMYLRTSDPGGTYENPAVFIDLSRSGSGAEEMTVRLRATRPVTRVATDLPGVAVNESAYRIYEAAATYRSRGGALDIAAGRILPRRLEGMGYLDGGGVLYRLSPGWTAGVAAGRGSDLAVAGFAGRGFNLGGFLEGGRAASSSSSRWHALLGAAMLRDSTLMRRVYVTQRADLTLQGRIALFQSAEVDMNPEWKQSLGEEPVTLTAWSVGGSVRSRGGTSLTASLDSRRPSLQPEQRLVPTPPSLDRYTGAHFSSRVAVLRDCSLLLGGGVRRRDRDGTRYGSADLGLTASRLGRRELSGGLHAMGYSGDEVRGMTGDAGLSARITTSIQLDLAGGLGRVTSDLEGAAPPPYRSQWLRAGIDYRGADGLWCRLSHEWREGGPGSELSAEAGVAF